MVVHDVTLLSFYLICNAFWLQRLVCIAVVLKSCIC